jgi:hypothetical protein
MYNQNAAFGNWKTERFVSICIHKQKGSNVEIICISIIVIYVQWWMIIQYA